jgi:hypothetical protein
MPNSNHLTYGISNLVSLITKTKLGLSATDPAKVTAVQQWHVPTSVKDLHNFLGLASYYRRFVKHFGIIAKPLTELLKKGFPSTGQSCSLTLLGL